MREKNPKETKHKPNQTNNQKPQKRQSRGAESGRNDGQWKKLRDKEKNQFNFTFLIEYMRTFFFSK